MRMRGRSGRVTVLTALLVVAAIGAAHAAEPPALVKARALYNDGDYDGAIDAASVARRQAGWADASALVIARSHIERYRQHADPKDLASAREVLGGVRIASLSPRDQVDLLVGLGLSLYLGEVFGAAANLFDSALTHASLIPAKDRSMLLDWWATSLDREAQTRPADRRRVVFERITARMQEELRQEPGNSIANYWLAVAARGAGDLEGAWDAAVAAWVVSTLAPETTESLRADLERLVQQALIPERSRLPGRDPQEAVAALRAEWELVKQQWK